MRIKQGFKEQASFGLSEMRGRRQTLLRPKEEHDEGSHYFEETKGESLNLDVKGEWCAGRMVRAGTGVPGGPGRSGDCILYPRSTKESLTRVSVECRASSLEASFQYHETDHMCNLDFHYRSQRDLCKPIH